MMNIGTWMVVIACIGIVVWLVVCGQAIIRWYQEQKAQLLNRRHELRTKLDYLAWCNGMGEVYTEEGYQQYLLAQEREVGQLNGQEGGQVL